MKLVVIPLLFGVVGCGVMANGRRWGQDAFTNVNRKTLTQAARGAFFDVRTLLPAATAVVFAATDLDNRVSDWATEQTPIFGSRDAAQAASDYLNWALQGETLATMIAAPSGSGGKPWWQAKLKGLAVEGLAAGLAAGANQSLKRLTNRTRPDRSDAFSFPSGHATTVFSMLTLSNRNLDTLNLTPRVRKSIQATNLLIALSATWARVEGDKHFPSDVLTGAALGHFVSTFIHDAFIGIPKSEGVRMTILPSKNGAMAHLVIPF